MVVYMSRSRRFIECVEINARTVDRGHSQIEYLDIFATLTDGSTMSLVNERASYDPLTGRFYSGHEYEEDTETVKEVWEKIKKAMLAGKAVTLKL